MKKIMRKFLLSCGLSCGLSCVLYAQKLPVKDSVVVITITREEVSNLIKAIDVNIDSKKASQELINFLLSRAVLVPKKEK